MSRLIFFNGICIVIFKLHVTTTAGVSYNGDCNALDAISETHILKKLTLLPSFKKLFPHKSIFTLPESKWTSEMEEIYVLEILEDNSRCSLVDTLECSFKPNENNQEINFHHHHSGENSKPESQGQHPRRADVPFEALEFDIMSELEPEWRCICNEAISFHNSTPVMSPSYKYPIFNDTCLIKVGFPCKYRTHTPIDPKHSVDNEVTYLKTTHSCVQNSECIQLSLPSNSSNVLPGSVSLVTVSEVQVAIKNEVGYFLNLPRMRNAYLAYILRHVTHICRCVMGFTHNGDGLCVPILGKRSFDFEGGGSNAADFMINNLIVSFMSICLQIFKVTFIKF